MANDNQQTTITDRNSDKRIIKRSGLKITVIIIMILLFLTLIGIGIYFIVESTKKESYDVDGWEIVSAEEAGEAIAASEASDEQFGVYFYKEGGDTSNFMLRNDSVYNNGEDGTGVLSEVIFDTKEDITWYGIEIKDDSNELIEEFLTVQSESDEDFDDFNDYIFREEFEYLGSGSSLRSDIWIMSSLSGDSNSTDDNYTPDDDKIESFSLQVQNNGDEDEDNLRDVLFYNSTTGGDGSTDGGDGTTEGGDGTTEASRTTRTSGNAYSVTDGTTMLFNGSQLTTVVNGWETKTVSDKPEEDGSGEDRDEWHEAYADYLDYLIDHNSDYFE